MTTQMIAKMRSVGSSEIEGLSTAITAPYLALGGAVDTLDPSIRSEHVRPYHPSGP